MMEIEALEAKERLTQLLDAVEAGEEVLIVRQGKAVARMLRPEAPSSLERARLAAARIRAMRKGVRLEGLAIHDLIREGRL